MGIIDDPTGIHGLAEVAHDRPVKATAEGQSGPRPIPLQLQLEPPLVIYLIFLSFSPSYDINWGRSRSPCWNQPRRAAVISPGVRR